MLRLTAVKTYTPPPLHDLALQLDALLHEYNALYGLVTFRMTSLDRRVPLAGATLAGFLSAVTVLPLRSQLIVLVGLPLAVLWYLRTTVNHARSLEDAFRRIEAVERSVNDLLGRPVMGFQSQHPSRGRFVGGRTGNETIASVMVASGTILAGCLYLFFDLTHGHQFLLTAYVGYVLASACNLVSFAWRLGRYSYHPSPRFDV